MFEVAKEMIFDEKAWSEKSTRDRTLIKLLKSPAMIVWSLEKKPFSKPTETKTRFLSSNLIELGDRLSLLLQDKQAGENSDKIIEEIVATVDTLLENKCITTKQHRFLFNECLH